MSCLGLTEQLDPKGDPRARQQPGVRERQATTKDGGARDGGAIAMKGPRGASRSQDLYYTLGREAQA